jgi:hypothetical protein
MKRKKRNLEGYKREGKRFIPPLKQLPMVQERSYVNDILPELIWLGLIHDRCGYRFGARTLEAIIVATKDWPAETMTANYALQSAYMPLDHTQKEAILSALRQYNLLDDIQQALAPLLLLYDGFSLSFVGPPREAIASDILVARITECVANHMNKFETPSIVLHGAMLLARLVAGTIKFSSQIQIPDLNSVITEPDSAEAKRAASFMRSNAMAEFGMLSVSLEWSKHFWNRGADLAPCSLPGYVHDR